MLGTLSPQQQKMFRILFVPRNSLMSTQRTKRCPLGFPFRQPTQRVFRFHVEFGVPLRTPTSSILMSCWCAFEHCNTTVPEVENQDWHKFVSKSEELTPQNGSLKKHITYLNPFPIKDWPQDRNQMCHDLSVLLVYPKSKNDLRMDKIQFAIKSSILWVWVKIKPPGDHRL